MVGAELGLPQRQRLLVELEGLGVPAEVVVAVGQVVHGRKRVGVVGAELGLLQRQRLLVELEGLGVPAERHSSWWPGCSWSERVGVVGAELGLLSASVSSRSLRASACRPRSP